MHHTFHPETGAVVPTLPNRHAAAHAVDPNQYTTVNAVKFVMLATAVLAKVEDDGWSRIAAIAA